MWRLMTLGSEEGEEGEETAAAVPGGKCMTTGCDSAKRAPASLAPDAYDPTFSNPSSLRTYSHSTAKCEA